MISIHSTARRLHETWVDLPLRTKGLIVVAIPILALLLATLWVVLLAHQERTADFWVNRTMDIRAGSQQVLTFLVDAETGMRGYLLTGRPEFLEPYQHARANLDAALAELEASVADDPDQAGRVDRIRRLAKQRMDRIDILIEEFNAGAKSRQALEPMLVDGKSTMDALRREFDGMQSEVDQLLAERLVSRNRTNRWFTGALGISMFAGLAGGFVAMQLFTTGIVRRMLHLRENAQRLAHGTELSPLARGDDEIGQVGDELQRAAALLAQREHDLRVTQAFLEHLIVSSPLLIFQIQPTTRAITYISPNVERLLGYAPEEIVDVPSFWLEHVHLDDRRPLVAAFQAAMDRKESGFEQEYRFLLKDGSCCWLQMMARLEYTGTGEVVHVLAYALDVTSRKETLEALHKSEQQFRVLFENSPEGIFLIDPHASEVLWPIVACNDAACRMNGYTRDELIGASINILHPEPIPPEVLAASLEHLRRDGTMQSEILHRRKDGTSFPIEYSISLLSFPDGELILGIDRDITSRKQAEEVIHQARKEAERANQAKSEFLSRMSHELRTPLNAILGFAQLLELEDPTPEQSESIRHILRAGHHLLELINEILDIARIEAGRQPISIEPVYVPDVWQEVLDLLRPMAAQRRIKIYDPELLQCERHVLADRQRLKQVYLNLLSNAIKYNREGGSIWASCDVQPDERVRLKVRDTGSGLSAAQMSRLFTPFDRLGAEQSAIEGTGIGLVLSKRLAELMGGDLGVESAVGQGSTFWVELPLVEGPVEQHQRLHGDSYPSMDEIQNEKATVLYIEDNLSNLKLVQRIVAHRPMLKLLVALQGGLGFELARQHQPDIILLDLHLPDMKGEAVLRRLQETRETQDIPVVVISADATPNQVERLQRAGAYAYLTKPLDVRKFLHVIEDVVAQARKER